MESTPQQTTQHPTKFYRLPQLKAYLGVSGSSIWAWTAKGQFPRPTKLSTNCTAWLASDIEAWAQSRIAASQK